MIFKIICISELKNFKNDIINCICRSNNFLQIKNLVYRVILFLFLMSAAAETLELEWKRADLEVLTIAHFPDNSPAFGCIWGHTPRMYNSRHLTSYKIYQLLYVDDSAFPFSTRPALIKWLSLIHSHLARFGLEVHIGWNGDPSKIECVFFPPPIFQGALSPLINLGTQHNGRSARTWMKRV